MYTPQNFLHFNKQAEGQINDLHESLEVHKPTTELARCNEMGCICAAQSQRDSASAVRDSKLCKFLSYY